MTEQNKSRVIYNVGVDVGSTTVKSVVTSEGQVLFSLYQRHFSMVRNCVAHQLRQIEEKFQGLFRVAITGSAGLGLAQSTGIPFVQEVIASSLAISARYPDTDVAVELGGEDAKIIFLTNGAEQRMNGTCAGGTGAFIDQMATLLDVTPEELDNLAMQTENVYPIASRCGVFAKTDVQALLNQGASKPEIAASIFQAVVDQTVSGLAQGRKIAGKVLFLGGPLHYFAALRRAFAKTLALSESDAVFCPYATVFVALGCAFFAEYNVAEKAIDAVAEAVEMSSNCGSLVIGKPLFSDKEEYSDFCARHERSDVRRGSLDGYKGKMRLGVDAGSTTTKLVVIGENDELLYCFYAPNKGSPLETVADELKKIYAIAGEDGMFEGGAATGYGEELLVAGLKLDGGIVETVAHFFAARYFRPDVDFIIDIGGQDIKCFKIRNGTIDDVMLNEACSSGCGSFFETFAKALNYDADSFGMLGLFARHPVELGSRCTVFMNSSVKQAQKDGASIEDISAGISRSIVKNAVNKVIRARSVDELGKNVVVQGGTFKNNAILRAFEQELGREVVRPQIAEFMGAFGCALSAKRFGKSGMMTASELKNFEMKTKTARCGGCNANCKLNIVTFSDGRRFVSGNKCERGAGQKHEGSENLTDFKRKRLAEIVVDRPNRRSASARVGLPLVLNFYEQLPFWHAFFTQLGFDVAVSDESTRETYFEGQDSIASDTVCYPAKLVHGHIRQLLGVSDFVFYPCESYNFDEKNGDNHYNCPVVAYYPELLKGNMSELNEFNFISPYLDINRKGNLKKVLAKSLSRFGVTKRKASVALRRAYTALKEFQTAVRVKGIELLCAARKKGQKVLVLAGRPYHADSEVNHNVHNLASSLGFVCITEDFAASLAEVPPLSVLNQWTFHARLYAAAQWVSRQTDACLVQLVSFGCGIDAITTDEVKRIVGDKGFYAQIKIDEISNQGAVKIRLRSLKACMEEREETSRDNG